MQADQYFAAVRHSKSMLQAEWPSANRCPAFFKNLLMPMQVGRAFPDVVKNYFGPRLGFVETHKAMLSIGQD